MPVPSIKHLFWLRHDKSKFEEERGKVISEYLGSVPERYRTAAEEQQRRIDEALATLTDEQLLTWFAEEARRLSAKLEEAFNAGTKKANELKQELQDGKD